MAERNKQKKTITQKPTGEKLMTKQEMIEEIETLIRAHKDNYCASVFWLADNIKAIVTDPDLTDDETKAQEKN